MTRFLPLAFLAACSVSHATDQADLVIAVYERDYADLSDADAECVRDACVRYARLGHDSVKRCGGGNIGCTVTGPRNARVWIGNGLSDQDEAWTLRHEYTNVLLWCVTGDSHESHDAPEFGYAAEVNAPGSLSAEADSL